uniref:Protoporphyrinogen oxidase n=1 Tax=Graphocephala atropunctata TaxID=36148 RepID=A0A1B6L6C7_9HEMI
MTAVLGGGISGLSAAYYLLKSTPQKVTIIEGSNGFGGWIRSIRNSENGFLFEKGPRTIRPKGPQGLNTLSLIEELNLSEKLIATPSSHPTARNRLIYANKKLHALPSSLFSLFTICSPFSKPLILSAFKDLTTAKVAKNDESIYCFVERRFGKEIADYAISSMICGICAGDAKEISVKFLMSEMFEWEQKHGSVLKGFFKKSFSNPDNKLLKEVEKSPLGKRALQEKWSVWTLKDGLQQLPDTLGKEVQKKGAKVKFNSLCTKLEFHGKNQVTCVIDDQKMTLNGMFDHVICSLPASTVAQLVADQHPTLSKELMEIKNVTVAVVNIAYRGNHLKHNAFGFLAPPKEKLPILGVIFDSCNLDYKEWTVLTVMMGGRWYEEYFGHSATEDTILETALREVSKILDIKQQPDLTHVSILKDCIPQYTIGHHDRVKRVMSYIEDHQLPLSLIGASYHGVGINDVIFSAKNVVDKLNKLLFC